MTDIQEGLNTMSMQDTINEMLELQKEHKKENENGK